MNGVKKTGGKVIGILVIVLIGLVVIKHPAATGNAGSELWNWLNGAADSLGDFLAKLTN